MVGTDELLVQAALEFLPLVLSFPQHANKRECPNAAVAFEEQVSHSYFLKFLPILDDVVF
jgi:hypothetical protein